MMLCLFISHNFQGCQQRLDDHNAKHDLNPYENRKPGQKLTEVIDLAALVPSGVVRSALQQRDR
ncbi:hypothetical protein [Anabaena sp. CCY 0017]|uniref:hypothetical protein n=1 Tax=Anabaena sp. CCY 0017 TaxID=3103866 RepID=UPI0039C6EA85